MFMPSHANWGVISFYFGRFVPLLNQAKIHEADSRDHHHHQRGKAVVQRY
jgi:hypothetical protein